MNTTASINQSKNQFLRTKHKELNSLLETTQKLENLIDEAKKILLLSRINKKYT